MLNLHVIQIGTKIEHGTKTSIHLDCNFGPILVACKLNMGLKHQSM
jgi:hypothetical protein